jgi:hypothetical protein
MTPRRRSVVPAVPPQPLSAAEAAERLGRMAETVTRLTQVIAEETRLVRAGAYDAAGALERAKGELSARYMVEVDRISSGGAAVAGQPREALADMEALHVAFRAALEENLLVLGTARSVAESLMRGVAEEVGARRAPSTYDARGGAGASRPTAAPLTVSRGA